MLLSFSAPCTQGWPLGSSTILTDPRQLQMLQERALGSHQTPNNKLFLPNFSEHREVDPSPIKAGCPRNLYTTWGRQQEPTKTNIHHPTSPSPSKNGTEAQKVTTNNHLGDYCQLCRNLLGDRD